MGGPGLLGLGLLGSGRLLLRLLGLLRLSHLHPGRLALGVGLGAGGVGLGP